MASYKGYEIPPFEVVRRDGAYELRDYAPRTLAVVTVQGPRSATLRQGFRTLAGYIFGGNEADASLAMTAPVAHRPAGEDLWTTTFLMPRDAVEAGLPAPRNSAVRIVEEGSERLAVTAFSGWATGARVDAKAQALRDWIVAERLRATGPARALYYDDPFTLPWRRRNEVAIPVE